MMADTAREWLTIGEVARRTGISVSAIRYYEQRGLIASIRSAGNQRRFLRGEIRRLSFIAIAQQLGLSLEEIEAELEKLPDGRTPNARDWRVISRAIDERIAAQIARLEKIRARLGDCIGCGCLSLEACALYNPQDRLGAQGPGARRLLGED